VVTVRQTGKLELILVALVTPSQHCLDPLPLLALTHCRFVLQMPGAAAAMSTTEGRARGGAAHAAAW
jgi:hypothetical protein